MYKLSCINTDLINQMCQICYWCISILFVYLYIYCSIMIGVHDILLHVSLIEDIYHKSFTVVSTYM